jgi:hypothetical protein
MLSATFVCSIVLYAGGKAVSKSYHLAGFYVGKRWYQQLSYVVNMRFSVRYSFDKL